MGVTNFPNGISQGLAAGGTGRFAAGTVVVPSGGAGTAFSTGLSSVAYVLAGVYAESATVAGYAGVAGAVGSGGTVTLRGISGAGTAATANGTATWLAFGT